MRQPQLPPKKNVMFTNWTTKPFTWTWGKQPMTFQPGQSTMMDEALALHFAKHLADREINEADAWAKFNSNKIPAYQELIKKAVSDVSTEEIAQVINDGPPDLEEIQRLNANRKTESELRTEMAKQNEKFAPVKEKKPFCDSCDSKGVRHKKDCPTNQKEFADLHAAA